MKTGYSEFLLRGYYLDKASKDPWSWRTTPGTNDRPSAGLLYEPGNWGDVLKGTWAVSLAQRIIDSVKADTFCYLDPFAGAPDYDLAPCSRDRFSLLKAGDFQVIQSPFVARNRWASTALSVRGLCIAHGVHWNGRVFDQDVGRREAWGRIEGAETLDMASGESALQKGSAARSGVDLVLVDPYDFFDHWGALLPPAIDMARSAPVLIYLYNKSPRGSGYQDQYRRMRKRLHDWLPAKLSALFGKLAADALEPRAYHEVVLLGESGLLKEMRHDLATLTRDLARHLDGQGAFDERFGGAGEFS